MIAVRTVKKMYQNQKNFTAEMYVMRKSFQILEETAVENARVENEVMLLRKRIAQSLNRSNSFPNLVRTHIIVKPYPF